MIDEIVLRHNVLTMTKTFNERCTSAGNNFGSKDNSAVQCKTASASWNSLQVSPCTADQ